MKKGFIQIFLLIGLAVGSVVAAQAQSASQYRMHIPFEFVAGEKTFAAGDYRVTFGGLSSSQRRLTVQTADGKETALVAVLPKETNGRLKNPTLVFSVYEGIYSLVEIKTNQLSGELYESKYPSKLAKKSRRVEVALTR